VMKVVGRQTVLIVRYFLFYSLLVNGPDIAEIIALNIVLITSEYLQLAAFQ